MMKKTIQFVPIIAIAMAGTMSSCVDSGKDLYDPSYETPNPMGDGFAAPDDIDWNMITTKNVSVEVKDEEGGLFAYLVEIYAEDPLTNESASVLAARTANKENNFKFTTAVSLLPTQKGIYVKQTDPRGREQVYQFDVPENSDNITCKLYYAGSTAQNRALMSRAAATNRKKRYITNFTLLIGDYSKIISIFAVYHKYYVTTILIYKSNNKASDRKVYSYEEKNITSRR